MQDQKKYCLFACAGLGMGNASRIAALLEDALNRPKWSQYHFVVATWGAGYHFLSEFSKNSSRISMIELNPYPIAGECYWSIIKCILFYPYIYFANNWKLYSSIKKYNFSFSIQDSDYHFLPVMLTSSKKFFLGQAWDVLNRAKEKKSRWNNWQEKMFFILREKLDAYIHAFLSDIVIVPSFSSNFNKGKLIYIPLIVRKEFLHIKKTRPNGELAILLSGSNLHSQKISQYAHKHKITLLDNVPSKAEELGKFSGVIIQGGLSSISECIATGTPICSIPMPNHPEQILNAEEIIKKGLGIS